MADKPEPVEKTEKVEKTETTEKFERPVTTPPNPSRVEVDVNVGNNPPAKPEPAKSE